MRRSGSAAQQRRKQPIRVSRTSMKPVDQRSPPRQSAPATAKPNFPPSVAQRTHLSPAAPTQNPSRPALHPAKTQNENCWGNGMRLHGRVGTSYMAETPERERTMPSKLDQLRAMTVVVADTGDIEAVRRLKPQDCTTNPTLLLKAVETPAYGHFLDEALHWGRAQGGAREAVAAAVCDRLAVAFGAELAGIVPGRVSTEVDADLSFDTAGTVETARAIVAAYAARGVPRQKILIKIASTWEGVRAAEVLQREGI